MKGKVYSREKTFHLCDSKNVCSDSIVRSSIPAFRAEDPGSNPGRSTKIPLSFLGQVYCSDSSRTLVSMNSATRC